MPEISIIVPNFNHAPYLHQRLNSILNQTFQDFEIILLDDNSTDKSIEILQEYCSHPKVVDLIVNKENSGSTFKQWVKGIELARGNYIWIAESDDYSDERFLEKTIQVIQREKCCICFTNTFVVDENINLLYIYNDEQSIYKKDFIMEGKDLIQDYFGYSNIIPNTSAVLFKREYLFSNLKDELKKFKINGDWFLWINLAMNGKCAFLSEPLNFFRRHSGAGSPKNVANYKNIEEAFRINIFLKRNGFKVNGRYWLKRWIGQSNYNVKTLLENNFFNIYKLSNSLFQVPLLYLMFLIICNKFRIFKRVL